MRRACLLAGLAVLVLTWGGPLLGAWRESFAAHMLAHMGVVAIAAPLLAIGIFFAPHADIFTPTPNPSPQGGGGLRGSSPSPLRGGVRGGGTKAGKGLKKARETATLLSLPVLASLLELVVVWFWHAPAMRALAETSVIATVVEQASFLAAGLFLWSVCLGRSGEGGVGAFGLLLTSVHMTLLGALLALSPRPLYGLDEVTCFGLTLGASQDQQAGGVVMLMIGAAVYLAGGVALLARLLARQGPGLAR